MKKTITLSIYSDFMVLWMNRKKRNKYFPNMGAGAALNSFFNLQSAELAKIVDEKKAFDKFQTICNLIPV